MEIFLDDKLGKISFEIDNATSADAPTLILAHGAGAGMHHPFMVSLANEISEKGTRVIRFNFPYMEQGRKAPGSPKQATLAWGVILEETIKRFPNSSIFLSGKSYGGRMASHLLAETHNDQVNGIIYFGFPLHAPGRDSKDRAAHLNQINLPQLFIQGERDKLANIEMIREVVNELGQASLIAIESGDHSFNVPKKVGTKQEIMTKLATSTANWIFEQ